MYPDVYRNVHEYGNRYCKGVSHLFITDKTLLISQFFFCCLWMSFHPVIVTWIFQGVFGVYQGASNHEELHNLIKATVMIRRLKKDVLSQLPVKRRQQVCRFITICSLQHFMFCSLLTFYFILCTLIVDGTSELIIVLFGN